MRARLEKVGGRFEIRENQPGVTVCFYVPAK
jgi:signal transduction histidine kinase